MLVAVIAGLVGCGGGGGGDAAPAPPPSVPANEGKVSVGPGCTTYNLTASPLLEGADPRLGEQWHLKNTGQSGGTTGEDTRAQQAWASTKGEGARIAVIDEAIELTHPDLRPNLVEGASNSYRLTNRDSPWPLPCGADDDQDGHGTAVAGLIAARDGNAYGVAGVAPRAALVGFDALSSGTDADIADALTRGSEAIGVYHNSWGSPDDGALHAADQVFAQSIRDGLKDGRGGKGAVYVFSAGNGGCFRRPGGVCQADDANYDGYVNGLGVVAVCAVDHHGSRAPYSEAGANLTVCAPSSGQTGNVVTTALLGRTRTDFSGTSASAPMVSGVVALMLSVNPALTWRDVRLILASTARRTQTDDVVKVSNPSGWAASGLPGARSDDDARLFSHRHGFGVVDAVEAVRVAKTWTSVGGSESLKACPVPGGLAPPQTIPDAGQGGLLSVTATVPAGAACDIKHIEFVEIDLTSDHTYAGDLEIVLTSPAGRSSRLAERRVCKEGSTCGSYASGFRFGSMRHLHEPAAGNWTLTVTDKAPGNTGRLLSWSLTIHGR